jgi:hypothetical protein
MQLYGRDTRPHCIAPSRLSETRSGSRSGGVSFQVERDSDASAGRFPVLSQLYGRDTRPHCAAPSCVRQDKTGESLFLLFY